MTTIASYTASASFTQQFGRIFAAALLVASLATTGCDMVDSNAFDEAGRPVTALSTTQDPRQRLGGPVRWITPVDDPMVFVDEYDQKPSPGWPMSHLVGAWVLASADIYPLPEGSIHPQITFREDGIFTGYAACYNFSGRYHAGSDGRLSVSDFRATHKFCFEENDPVRGILLTGLQAATEFRFEHGTLWIMSRGGKREMSFIFERTEENGVPRDIGLPPTAGR